MSDQQVMDFGTCRFCGQVKTVSKAHGLDEEGADEYVTLHCDCPEGVNHRLKEEKRKKREKDIKKIYENIDTLFVQQQNEKESISKDVVDIMRTAAVMVYDNLILDFSVRLSYAVKAKISQTSKGNVSIERKDATSSKMEV